MSASRTQQHSEGDLGPGRVRLGGSAAIFDTQTSQAIKSGPLPYGTIKFVIQ